MILRPSETSARNVRRWIFWIWIALTIAAAIYVGALAPLATIFDMNESLVAVVVPPLMILLAGIGFIWLVLYVLIPPRRDGSQTGEVAPAHGR